jgi:hypothetical protein
MAADRRKSETRHKIQLGGLVIKAGLGGIDAMALLGLLVERTSVARDAAELNRLQEVGRGFVARTTAGRADQEAE